MSYKFVKIDLINSFFLISRKMLNWITFSIWQISMIWTFQLFKLNCNACKTVWNCCHLHVFIFYFSKLRQLNYFFWKFDKNCKCLIGYNVNSEFVKVWRFEVQKFDYLNHSIIWFDAIQKNVELKLKFRSDNWLSFSIWLFELIL